MNIEAIHQISTFIFCVSCFLLVVLQQIQLRMMRMFVSEQNEITNRVIGNLAKVVIEMKNENKF